MAAVHQQSEWLLLLLQKALGHELPNQMIAIQGLANLLGLELEDKLGPEEKEYLQRMETVAVRVHSLVRALAEYVRIGRLPVPDVPVSLNQVVRQAVAKVGSESVPIEVELPVPDRLLRIPAPVLQQLVLAPLQNAVQACQSVHSSCITLRVTGHETETEIVVKDSGPGIDSRRMDRIFDPFACRDQESERLGCGLLIVRHLAESYGGRLRVESTDGPGTQVTIVLPSPDSDHLPT